MHIWEDLNTWTWFQMIIKLFKDLSTLVSHSKHSVLPFALKRLKRNRIKCFPKTRKNGINRWITKMLENDPKVDRIYINTFNNPNVQSFEKTGKNGISSTFLKNAVNKYRNRTFYKIMVYKPKIQGFEKQNKPKWYEIEDFSKLFNMMPKSNVLQKTG